jgi:hypothetical protein
LNFKILAASGEERDQSSAIVVLSALARLAAGKKPGELCQLSRIEGNTSE